MLAGSGGAAGNRTQEPPTYFNASPMMGVANASQADKSGANQAHLAGGGQAVPPQYAVAGYAGGNHLAAAAAANVGP